MTTLSHDIWLDQGLDEHMQEETPAELRINRSIDLCLKDEDELGELLPAVYTEFELTEAARCIMANDPHGLMDFFRTSLVELARRKYTGR